MTEQEANAALDAHAATKRLPGLFAVEPDSRGWAVRYWWSRSRLVTHSHATIEAAVERAKRWIDEC